MSWWWNLLAKCCCGEPEPVCRVKLLPCPSQFTTCEPPECGAAEPIVMTCEWFTTLFGVEPVEGDAWRFTIPDALPQCEGLCWFVDQAGEGVEGGAMDPPLIDIAGLASCDECCPDILGACCVNNETCLEDTLEQDCLDLNGEWFQELTCADIDCEPTVPFDACADCGQECPAGQLTLTFPAMPAPGGGSCCDDCGFPSLVWTFTACQSGNSPTESLDCGFFNPTTLQINLDCYEEVDPNFFPGSPCNDGNPQAGRRWTILATAADCFGFEHRAVYRKDGFCQDGDYVRCDTWTSGSCNEPQWPPVVTID